MTVFPNAQKRAESSTSSTPELGRWLTLAVVVDAVVQLMKVLLETSWQHRRAVSHALTLAVACSVPYLSGQEGSPA
jgi:hypothetical protein